MATATAQPEQVSDGPIVDELIYRARKCPIDFFRTMTGWHEGHLQGRMFEMMRTHRNCTIMVPRGHAKTTVGAYMDAWDIGHEPGIRIKLIAQNDTEAGKTSVMVRNIVDSPQYRRIFPEIAPDPAWWSQGSWSVLYNGERASQRDPTYEAKGIFGRAGGRVDKLRPDDVCDLKNSVQSAVEREKVKESYRTNWLPMRELPKIAEKRGIPVRVHKTCTPYHVDDLTQDWKSSDDERGDLLYAPIVDYQPVWPEGMSTEQLMEVFQEVGPTAYARSYELRPASDDDIMFPQAWVDASMRQSIPEWDRKNGRAMLIVDWAFSESKTTKKDDPDWSVGLICWNAFNGELYVLDCIRMKKDYPTFSRSVISNALENQWLSHFGCANESVQQCWAEGNGPQRGIVQVFRNDAPFPVNSIDRDRDKVTRAAEVQSFVQQGHLHIMGSPGEPLPHLQAVYDELTLFPVAGHDDTVDTVIDAINKVDRKAVRSPNSSRIRSVPRYDGVMM